MACKCFGAWPVIAHLLLAGCVQDPNVSVVKRGAIIDIAVAREGGGEAICVMNLLVSLDGADVAETPPLWELSTAERGRCASSFSYGQELAGFGQSGPAPVLKVGTRYLVEVTGPGLIGGAIFAMRAEDGSMVVPPTG